MHSFCSCSVPMIETYTLACCKSPDTSARVTVTPLTRGSRSSNRIVSLATSRITSETRASRCAFMPRSPVRRRPVAFCPSALDVDLMIDELRHRVILERPDDLVEGGPYVADFIAHHRKTQDGELAVILFLDLRHRHVELVPQPVLDAANHLAFVLQAARLAEEQ